ncbi:MAG: hypothetical protein V4671_32680 [Armatimonadota bacterium]
MACEIRNGRRYYYRSRRIGDKVVREYLGAGSDGLYMEMQHQFDLEQVLSKRALVQSAEVSAQRVERRAKRWYQVVEVEFREAMASAGYYQHRGGEWRKRRQKGKEEPLVSITQSEETTEETTELTATSRDDHALFTALRAWPHMAEQERQRHLQSLTDHQRSTIVDLAQRGKRELVPVALDVVRPQSATVYRETFGSIASAVNLVVPSKDNTPVSREVVVTEAKRLLRQIAGDAPTPLETLLASRIVTCGLVVDNYQKRLAQVTAAGNMAAGLHWEKRLDAANRRYLASIKSLALVRRLQIPMLQVNIGQNQVNVAGQGAVQANASQSA